MNGELIVKPKDLALAVKSSGSPQEKELLEKAAAELWKFPQLLNKMKELPLRSIVGTTTTARWPDMRKEGYDDKNLFGVCYFRPVGNSIFLNLSALSKMEDWEPRVTNCVRVAHEGPEAIAATLTHELGHHLFRAKINADREYFKRAIKTGLDAAVHDRAITRSARSAPEDWMKLLVGAPGGSLAVDEWFAESFAAFHYHQDDLVKLDQPTAEICAEVLQ